MRLASGLDAELNAPIDGSPLVIWQLGAPRPAWGSAAVVVGVGQPGEAQEAAMDACDMLLTAQPDPPAPWVGLPEGLEAGLANLARRADAKPLASAMLGRLLRLAAGLDFADALQAEAMAYSALLGGAEFAAWRRSQPVRAAGDGGAGRIRLTRSGTQARLALARPARRNAFDAAMRDALAEALRAVAADPDLALELVGEGPDFCAGGDLDEFGTQRDTALAWAIRTLRPPALMLHELGARATARLHGACIGAGIEIPAAAARVLAAPGTWFQLPEIAMGLIPGAGGTVSLPRRIGRHRTMFLALSNVRLDLATALRWGLVDAQVPG